MADFTVYKSTPVGSLLLRDLSEEQRYLDQLSTLPPRLLDIITTNKTGAFVRGALKSLNIPLTEAPKVAFLILRAAFGEIQLSSLTTSLATELKIAPAAAQQIAQEIERELFAPIMLEYNEFLKNKIKNTPHSSPPAHVSGARNVLDLKNQRPVPPPPPIPRN